MLVLVEFLTVTVYLNVRKYRRGNHKWTVQRNWQHRVQDKGTQNKNTTQYVLDTTMRKQTQITFIRHEPSLQTTGGKDEPNIVFTFLYFLFIILF